MHIACVGVAGMCGATEASATLNPETPCTLQRKSQQDKNEKKKKREEEKKKNIKAEPA